MTPAKRRILIFGCFALGYLAALLALQEWPGAGLRARLVADRQSALLAQVSGWKDNVRKETLADTAWVRPLYASVKAACPALRSVTLLDDKGRIVLSTDPDRQSGAEQNPAAVACLLKGKTNFYPGLAGDGLDLLLFAGFAFNSKAAGGVTFAFDAADIDAAVRELLFRARLLLAAAFLLAALAFLLFTEREAGLNREMQRGLYLLGSGNFAFQVKSTQLGEAGEIFRRFNEAVAALKLREERKNALLEKAKLLGVEMRFDSLFENLINRIREELCADSMLLLVIKDESLVVGAVSGYDEGMVFKEEVYRIQEDVFTEVLEYGRPIFLEDASEIRNNARYAGVLRHSGEVALFPVTLGNEIYGILHVARTREKGPYKASEIDAGVILCGGAAVAMTHLVERGETAPAIPGADPKPVTSEHRCAGLVIRTLALPDAQGWADYFTIDNEKKTECLLVAASGADSSARARVRDRISGMVDLAGHLKPQVGSLSYFALSVLLKMPGSPMRDKLLEQFKTSPFAPEGLRGLLRAASPASGATTAVEVVRFDSQKRTVSAAVERLDLFALRAGVITPLLSSKASFTQGDSLIAAPKGLFTAGDLSVITAEQDPGRALMSLYDRCQESRKAGRAPVLLFTGLFAARFTDETR